MGLQMLVFFRYFLLFWIFPMVSSSKKYEADLHTFADRLVPTWACFRNPTPTTEARISREIRAYGADCGVCLCAKRWKTHLWLNLWIYALDFVLALCMPIASTVRLAQKLGCAKCVGFMCMCVCKVKHAWSLRTDDYIAIKMLAWSRVSENKCSSICFLGL